MHVVRSNTFETNSSSIHSITVARSKMGVITANERFADVFPITEKNIVVGVGQFIIDFVVLQDMKSVLRYIYTATYLIYGRKHKKYLRKINKILNKRLGIKITWLKPKKFEAQIDHVEELKSWLVDLFNDDDLLLDTILYGCVTIDNDLIGMYTSSHTKKTISENYYDFRKGHK